jgi:hypothetical protein
MQSFSRTHAHLLEENTLGRVILKVDLHGQHLRYKYLTIKNVITMTAHTADDYLHVGCMYMYTVARLLSLNIIKSPSTPIDISDDAQENVPDEDQHTLPKYHRLNTQDLFN